MCLPFSLFAGMVVVGTSSSSTTVEITLDNLQFVPTEFNGKTYKMVDFDGSLLSEEPGKPRSPYLETRIGVPMGSRVQYQVSILESDEYNSTDLVPQIPEINSSSSTISPEDESVYSSAAVYPSEVVEMSDPYYYRRLNVVRLRISPVKYFPALHRLQIIKKMQVTVTYQGGAQHAVSIRPVGKTAELLRSKIANLDQAREMASASVPGLRKVSANYDFSVGSWFRIPIKDEGVYALTGSFLKENNINIGDIQLSTVQMFSYGGSPLLYNVDAPRPKDLNEVAVKIVDNNGNGLMDEDDRVLFYGRGITGWNYNNDAHSWVHYMNPYDNTNYYLFTFNGQQGKRILVSPSPQEQNAQIAQTFTDYFHFEEDHLILMATGLDWFWTMFQDIKDSKTIQFELPDHLAEGPIGFRISFQGGSGFLYYDTKPYTYNVNGSINGVSIFQNLRSSTSRAFSTTVNFPDLTGIKTGENTLQLDYTGNLSGCYMYLDDFEISAQRPFAAENGVLNFKYSLPANSPVEFQVSGLAGSGNTVWDITDFANVHEITPRSGSDPVTFQDESAQAKNGQYLVFSGDAVAEIASIEKLENHPDLRDPSRKGQFLIVTPDEFYDAAEYLVSLRETQAISPLQTERIRIKDIFAEFSSGVRDVTAIRDFLKYAYQNWSVPPEYVLLFGDGHYDYRQIQLKDYPNYIPPFEISGIEETKSRESDNYYVAFGMKDTNDIDPDLPIGRLPFKNLDEIEAYREKSLLYPTAFLQNPEDNGWQTWITLVADDQYGGLNNTNEWYHFRPTEDISNDFIPNKFNRTKIYLQDYEVATGGLGRIKPKATEDLLNQINQGTLLINYFGHGNPDTWADESVLTRGRDLAKINNVDRLSLWVAATCDWGKFDDPARTSMSEELVLMPRRGAIGVISSSRPVYVQGNTALAKSFYSALFHSHSEILPSALLGDAFYLSMTGGDNYQKYHLFGDPTQQLADPKNQIRLESIEPDTLKALSTVTVKATVRNTNGTLLSDFDGYAVLHVFDVVDSEYVYTSTTQDPSSRVNYTYRGGTIFKGLVSLKNGQMTGQFIVPKSIKYKKSPTGRISLYAWSDDGQDAIGFVDTLLVYGSESNIADQKGPDVDVAFEGIPQFFDGDYVGAQPSMELQIRDDSGINTTGEVGHRIELMIDDAVKKDLTNFFVYKTDSYQEGELKYTLPALSTGTHVLKLSCWDNLNNYTEKEITIRTNTSDNLTLAEVVNFPNPFSGSTYFTFQLVAPSGSADLTINVYTVTGRKIKEINTIGHNGFNRVFWDGLDRDGDILANGVYLYKITAEDGSTRTEKIEKLAIVR